MSPLRIQGDRGQFEQKGDEPRKNRMLTLTDTAWKRLQEAAQSRGISRSDLVEYSSQEGSWFKETDQIRDKLLSDLRERADRLLLDESVVRKRDRAVVRRAILFVLSE